MAFINLEKSDPVSTPEAAGLSGPAVINLPRRKQGVGHYAILNPHGYFIDLIPQASGTGKEMPPAGEDRTYLQRIVSFSRRQLGGTLICSGPHGRTLEDIPCAAFAPGAGGSAEVTLLSYANRDFVRDCPGEFCAETDGLKGVSSRQEIFTAGKGIVRWEGEDGPVRIIPQAGDAAGLQAAVRITALLKTAFPKLIVEMERQ